MEGGKDGLREGFMDRRKEKGLIEGWKMGGMEDGRER